MKKLKNKKIIREGRKICKDGEDLMLEKGTRRRRRRRRH